MVASVHTGAGVFEAAASPWALPLCKTRVRLQPQKKKRLNGIKRCATCESSNSALDLFSNFSSMLKKLDEWSLCALWSSLAAMGDGQLPTSLEQVARLMTGHHELSVDRGIDVVAVAVREENADVHIDRKLS